MDTLQKANPRSRASEPTQLRLTPPPSAAVDAALRNLASQYPTCITPDVVAALRLLLGRFSTSDVIRALEQASLAYHIEETTYPNDNEQEAYYDLLTGILSMRRPVQVYSFAALAQAA